ncbi:MAG: EAL domain-containing protein [Pseudomonadota bacterium]
MHSLLRRQIKRYLKNDDSVIDKIDHFLDAIEKAYEQNDEDRRLLDRSLHLMSEELTSRNKELEEKLSELKSAQTTLEHSLATLNGTFDATGSGILSMDSKGILVKSNSTAKEILKIDESYEGKSFSVRMMLFMVKNAKEPSSIIQDIRAIASTPEKVLFGVVEMRDGQIYEYHSAPQMKDGRSFGRVWSFRNITEFKKNEALVLQAAYYDTLTKLPNRLLVLERIERAIHLANRTKNLFALIFIDMDNFKKVNDICGHQAGDNLIVDFAQRIKRTVREHDTLGRLGGDEFVILLDNLNSHRFATEVSKRILTELEKPFVISNREFYVSCSLGISIFPRDGDEAQALIKKADMAMYHAKEMGKNNYQYFNIALERLAVYQIELEENLRRALKNNDLQIYYQPIVDLKKNRIVCVEALLRWFDDNHKPIRPDEFITIAEQTGLIVDVGSWVLERVCQQIAEWKKNYDIDIMVAINLSPRQIREKNFFDKIQNLMLKYDIKGHNIELEITETFLMEDVEEIQKTLKEFRKLNISVAIDDFGTGYSSLSYLKNLTINTLKIDKSFITELDKNDDDASIARTIIAIAHNLNLSVTAEGVENDSVLRFLRENYCDRVQGYFFHKPATVTTITKLLESQKLQMRDMEPSGTV